MQFLMMVHRKWGKIHWAKLSLFSRAPRKFSFEYEHHSSVIKVLLAKEMRKNICENFSEVKTAKV